MKIKKRNRCFLYVYKKINNNNVCIKRRNSRNVNTNNNNNKHNKHNYILLKVNTTS